jgi:hypothetical protein
LTSQLYQNIMSGLMRMWRRWNFVNWLLHGSSS